MKKRDYIIIFFGIFLIFPGLSSGEKTSGPREATAKIVTTIKMEADQQKNGKIWEREQNTLSHSIRETMLEIAWYEKQIKLFEDYVSTAEKRVNKLKKTKKDAQQVEESLEILLKDTTEKLKLFVKSDLPFLEDERLRRLNFIDKTMADYDLDPAEKLRRVTEALQVELEYGQTIDVTQETREIDGINHRVKCLRIGRVGLYALSPNGNSAWSWNHKKGFAPLDQNSLKILNDLFLMIEMDSVTKLAPLPVRKGVENEI